MLGVLLLLGAFSVLAVGLLTWFDLRRAAANTYQIAVVIGTNALIIGALSVGPALLFWYFIPSRGMDVLYLRSFRADRASWKTARHLRRALVPFRLAGVVDPQEARRLFHLLYWLLYPFMFALGDLSRVNATRHNLFLEGDWRVGIKAGFSCVRAAVFDCRMVTQSLAWEIATGVGMLSPKRMFFITTPGVSPLELQRSLTPTEGPASPLDAVPLDNFVPVSSIPLLAERIRQVCGPDFGQVAEIAGADLPRV